MMPKILTFEANNLGDLLRIKRRMRGLSRPQVALRVGCSQKSIEAYEKAGAGGSYPGILIAVRLADVLEISPDAMFEMVRGEEGGS